MASEEYYEEESLMLVELSGIIDNGFLQTCGSKCKLLNVETEGPILQLGHYVFKGEYEDMAGTAVIFEVDSSLPLECGLPSDIITSNQGGIQKPLKFFNITRKKLNMTRAFLSEKHSLQVEPVADDN